LQHLSEEGVVGDAVEDVGVVVDGDPGLEAGEDVLPVYLCDLEGV
jgi:hypothetical protein